MEISPNQPVLGNEKLASTNNVKKPDESVSQENTAQTDTVTLSDEAVAAAKSDSGVITPSHAGGGVYVPPKEK